jgi:LPXTG-motif cell wall-anchored protein
MFKKIASLVIAATMLSSTAAIAVSAAEADDSSVAADSSSEVGADSSSEVGADSSDSTGAEKNVISFDVKKSGWGNVKNMFCHIWRPDGQGEAHSWQSKKEKCTYDAATGIATYDLSKTNFDISKSDGREYCVIFSANTGMQTYNTIMSGSCIGDTMYCSGEQIENPEDSEKKAAVAVWMNNPDCGPEKKVTSTGNIVGSAYPDGESDITLVATYLIQYYNDPAKTDLAQDVINKLKVSPVDVMAEVKKRVGADDPDGKIPAVEKVLTNCTDPTKGGEKVDKDALSNVEAAGSNNNSSNNSNKNNTNNSSNSTGSNSVSSGQETTVLFVLGSVMLAAAGVLFLSRKKNEI